jgi:hypothetical protein
VIWPSRSLRSVGIQNTSTGETLRSALLRLAIPRFTGIAAVARRGRPTDFLRLHWSCKTGSFPNNTFDSKLRWWAGAGWEGAERP